MESSGFASRLRLALSPARPFARFLLAAAAGIVIAGIAYLILAAQLGDVIRQSSPALAPIEPPVAEESFALRIAPGKVVIGVPSAGQEPLLAQLRVGDAVDVLAILPGEAGTSGTALRRVPVLRDGGRGGADVLLEVTPEESVGFAHLIGRGARFTYAVWPNATAAAPVPLRAVTPTPSAAGSTAAPGGTSR